MQEFQNAAYGTGGQLAPQGFFGSLLGAPLGGAIGRGIGGLFGNSNLGNQIGSIAGGIGGTLLPFGADPVSAAYAQQAQQQQLMQQQSQLAPQGWFGNLLGQVGAPVGGAIGGLFGNAGLGSTIGGAAGQLGKLLPFGADPVAAAYAQQVQQAQQQQLAPQGWFGNLLGQVGAPVGGAIGGLFGNAGLGSTIGGAAGQLGKLLPFGADPVAAAYAQQVQQAQQQQLAPQGWFGNILGQVGAPLGGAIGGLFGNSGLGSTIGGAAGQLGKLLPFGADPVAAAYAQQLQAQQQQQLSPQGWGGNLLGKIGRPLGGTVGGWFGNAGLGGTIGGAVGQLGSLLPFGADPVAAAYAQQVAQAQQQQQLAPQGWIGDMIAKVAEPVGSTIGGWLGNESAGSTVGGIAGQLAELLPFGADPVSQAYAQQAAQQQLAPQGWFGNVLKQVGAPLGGAIGGMFGNQGVGSTIGGIAGQLGGLLPFGADPNIAANYQRMQQHIQQLQHQYQQQIAQLAAQQQQQQLQQVQQAQQQQAPGIAPQSLFAGSGPFGLPRTLQSMMSCQPGIGGRPGQMLPFGADPITAAYAQMAAQQGMPQYSPQQTLH